MGKINGCLKCLFIFFNAIYAVLGCVLVYLTARATVFSHQKTANQVSRSYPAFSRMQD